MKSHQVVDQPQPGKISLREKKKARKKKKELHEEKKGNLTGWWFNPSKAQQGRHPVCQVHETPGFRVCVKMMHQPHGFRICVK